MVAKKKTHKRKKSKGKYYSTVSSYERPFYGIKKKHVKEMVCILCKNSYSTLNPKTKMCLGCYKNALK